MLLLFATLLYPSNIERCFVASGKFFDRVFAPTPRRIFLCIESLGASVDVIWVVALHKVIEMMTLQFVGGKCVLDIGAVVIEPNFLCWLPLGEEQHVCLDTLRIEDACRQAKNGMKIKLRD